MTENVLAKQIVDATYRIHVGLGPGLFESVYTETQQDIPVVYEGTRFEIGFRADLIVEDLVIVEIKSVSEVTPVHKKQLLTYLRLADKRLGLLINFNVNLMRD